MKLVLKKYLLNSRKCDLSVQCNMEPVHNVQPKLKVQAGFARNSVLLCTILYIYYDEVMRDDSMEELRIFQVTDVQKYTV